MSTHNIGFYEEISKISLNYHQVSSNTHLISSPEISLVDFPILVFILGLIMSQNWEG